MPSQSRDAHLRRTRQLVESVRRDALTTFESTLESGLLQPLEQRLVPPRVEAIDTLAMFVATAEHHRQILRDAVDAYAYEETP